MNQLETQRLLLRKWELDDLDDFYEYASNPNVGPIAGWAPHTDKEYTREILHACIECDNMWAIVLKSTNKVIGSIATRKDDKRDVESAYVIGFVLSEPYWGQGFMPESIHAVVRYGFEEMNLSLMTAYHFTRNHRCQKVLSKCGFQYEGTLRKASTSYTGEILDEMCYSITKEEA
ncbi:MAG TPA: GNAT family protein [Lachnospiraceae bacterium]|nr:GNAT family protein [Lachnospiraceae bacterium]HEX3078517.1 GNAT family protein [Lachnospiraceae bacterium]